VVEVVAVAVVEVEALVMDLATDPVMALVLDMDKVELMVVGMAVVGVEMVAVEEVEAVDPGQDMGPGMVLDPVVAVVTVITEQLICW
jgi:hypothetical protein